MTPAEIAALTGIGVVLLIALWGWLTYRRICKVDEIEQPMGRERIGL